MALVGTQANAMYVFFPKYTPLPGNEAEAQAMNYTRDMACNASSKIGNVWIDPDKQYTLAPFFTEVSGELAGLIFAVKKSHLSNEAEEFSPWSHGDYRGHVYWIRDPDTICTAASPASGLWTVLPGRGIVNMGSKSTSLADLGGIDNGVSGKWTEHLCLTG